MSNQLMCKVEKLIWEFESDSLYLYNLAEDIAENKNLGKIYPEKGNELLSKLKQWQLNVDAEMPFLNLEYNDLNTEKK